MGLERGALTSSCVNESLPVELSEVLPTLLLLAQGQFYESNSIEERGVQTVRVM